MDLGVAYVRIPTEIRSRRLVRFCDLFRPHQQSDILIENIASSVRLGTLSGLMPQAIFFRWNT